MRRSLLIPTKTSPSIEVVDYQAVGESNGNAVTLNFTAQQNDVVVVFHIQPPGANNIGISTAGYTEAFFNETVIPVDMGVYYKVMGSTPDSSVTTLGSGTVFNGNAACCYVLRNVNTSNPLDVAVSGIDNNPPAITTVTNKALVIVCTGRNTSGDSGTYSDYTTKTAFVGNGNIMVTANTAYKEKLSAGLESSATWSSWTGSMYSVTTAWRPAA